MNATIQRQCHLILDLAEEEIVSRQHASTNGHASNHQTQDLGQDMQAIRPYIKAIPEFLRLLQAPIQDWPEFEDDSPVSGGDLVDYFAHWRQHAKSLLHSMGITNVSVQDRPMREALSKGFIILNYNGQNQPDSRYEAWLYVGPCDFNLASSRCFGLGNSPWQALDAVIAQLS